ncbi:Tn3 family transposase [Enterobacter kobei]
MKFLENIPSYLFFTGKGGVGKTSISCATAIRLAELGKRVLLVSTDPASNVGQVFDQTIGNTIQPVTAVSGLSALEIDPQDAAQQYRARIVDPIKGLLPDDVVNSISEQLSGACTTEIAAFDEFTGLLTDASLLTRFDHIIFDTAPTGHTISLLQLPGAWSSFIESNPDGASCLGPMAGLEKQREQYAHAVEALPALTRHRLSWVKQNYLRAETLVSANARLVDFQSTLELAGRWGGGEVASADGMRFVTPVKTVNSGPNRKYFGSGRGITWYNFVSDQYSGFHGIVVPGTLRDSIFVLEGLLEQQTGLNPVEIMTDTAGTSDIIFGLFWLLGYQFSPRLADAGEAVFWRVDKSANYGALDELARGCADLSKAEDQWDEMMRTAGSLKLGTIHASELIRSLLKSSRPSGLAQAIMEVGRVNKTLYLLNYIDDEDYRRRILTQLNRGEGRHAVARAICYGQRGEIRKRYREGQEDQLGALGLVTNAVVLWNTLYMQEALSWIRSNGEEIGVEDIARLSPLMHGHINMLGHYTFTLPEDILKGELRELNFNLNNELTS